MQLISLRDIGIITPELPPLLKYSWIYVNINRDLERQHQSIAINPQSKCDPWRSYPWQLRQTMIHIFQCSLEHTVTSFAACKGLRATKQSNFYCFCATAVICGRLQTFTDRSKELNRPSCGNKTAEVPFFLLSIFYFLCLRGLTTTMQLFSYLVILITTGNIHK